MSESWWPMTMNKMYYVSCDLCGLIADEAVKDDEDPRALAEARGFKQVDGRDLCPMCLSKDDGVLPEVLWPAAVSQSVSEDLSKLAARLKEKAPGALRCLNFYGVAISADPQAPKTASRLREAFVEVQLQLLARLYAAGEIGKEADAGE